MKTIFYILIFSTIFSCGSNHDSTESKPAPVAEETQPATEEAEPTAPAVQKTMLVGQIEKSDLMQPPFSSWFMAGNESFSPADAQLEIIKDNISEFDNIKIFMGTWCGDSKREVPHFYKILELSDYNLEKVDLVAVDRRKTTPDNLQEVYNITRVPTIIFFKDGKEVNRFVEYPQENLETDIANIVSGKDYKNSYAQ
ncbi:MAG TPA: thioredoxin domain-containing protein [Salinimicrobium sp.]|nr:thioredoxin domain-containing protein [Salinimicrobium sp.]